MRKIAVAVLVAAKARRWAVESLDNAIDRGGMVHFGPDGGDGEDGEGGEFPD